MQIQHTDLGKGYRWNQLSPRVATITARHKPDFRVAYFAFHDEATAKQFWEVVTTQMRCRCQVRESERFSGYPIECKAWGLPKAFIKAIANVDIERQYQAVQEERDYYHLAA